MTQRAPATSTTFRKHNVMTIFVILKSGTKYTRGGGGGGAFLPSYQVFFFFFFFLLLLFFFWFDVG